jgi:hypothetical protein
MTHRILGVLVVAWSMAAGAPGQSLSPPVHPATPGPDVLAGPQVGEARRGTLVAHEYDGTVRRPDEPAEIAAVRLLDLPGAVRAKIDDIVAERDRFLDSFVENNLDLLSKLDTAGKTNDKLDQAMLGLEAVAKLVPLGRHGSLQKRIRAVLPAEAAKRFDAILEEYRDAVVAQERAKDPKKPRFAILAGERVQSLLREVAAAFQRLEKSGVLLYQYFFKDAELTKEQEAAIRAILDEFVEETKGAPTKQQEATVFLAVMSKLDVKQQTALIRRLKSGTPTKTHAVVKPHADRRAR